MAASEGRPLVEAVEHRYGCFRGFGFGWCRGHEEGKDLVEQRGDSWVSCKLRKVKEFSEVIAGPRWKTFIRKISWYGRKQQKNRFRYDEHSYALNFNSRAQSEDDNMPPSFSARYASGRRQTER